MSFWQQVGCHLSRKDQKVHWEKSLEVADEGVTADAFLFFVFCTFPFSWIEEKLDGGFNEIEECNEKSIYEFCGSEGRCLSRCARTN